MLPAVAKNEAMRVDSEIGSTDFEKVGLDDDTDILDV
jgi:hypothetical protein